ncbi:MAG: hypothetical protein Q7J35_10935 [Candidatus Methanoperedens sp.]|nr:hypothetical protein [Candidatus Methanoperedens sp.]
MGEKRENGNKKCIPVELGKEFIEKIDHLVNDAGQFKSRDDFVELACHEFMVQRNPLGNLLACIYVCLAFIAIRFLQDLVEPAIAILGNFQA